MPNQIYFNIPNNPNIDNEPNWIEKSIMEVFKELNKLIFPINISLNKNSIAVFGQRDNYVYYTLTFDITEEYEKKIERYIKDDNLSLQDKMKKLYGDDEKVERIIELLTGNYKQIYRENK